MKTVFSTQYSVHGSPVPEYRLLKLTTFGNSFILYVYGSAYF